MSHSIHAYNRSASQTRRTAAHGPSGPPAGISIHPENRGNTPTASQTSLASQRNGMLGGENTSRNSLLPIQTSQPHEANVVSLTSALQFGVVRVESSNPGFFARNRHREVRITYRGQHCTVITKNGKVLQARKVQGWLSEFDWAGVRDRAQSYTFNRETLIISKAEPRRERPYSTSKPGRAGKSTNKINRFFSLGRQ